MVTAIEKKATKGKITPPEIGADEILRRSGEAVSRQLTIKAPNLQVVSLKIRGVAPLVQNKFPAKALEQMREAQMAGSTAKKGKKREAKDFQAAYEAAFHRGPKGQYGIPASAFRKAMISACRLCGFTMTLAKLSVFVEADFFEPDTGFPLVQLFGEPTYSELPVRNATGVVDIRARPMWHQWHATVRVRFDGDQFTYEDITNLMMRVGLQVGIQEGRADSKNSAGMDWGFFEVCND